MWPNPQFPADLVILNVEIFHEKLHFFVQCKAHTNFTIIRLFHIKDKLIWLFVKRVKA